MEKISSITKWSLSSTFTSIKMFPSSFSIGTPENVASISSNINQSGKLFFPASNTYEITDDTIYVRFNPVRIYVHYIIDSIYYVPGIGNSHRTT